MLRIVTMTCAGLALAGCQTAGEQVVAPAAATQPSAAVLEKAPGYVRPRDDVALAGARKSVAGKLKDPESARFTDVKRSTNPNARGEPTDVVCGQVNSKNSYGGYTGAKPFVYIVATAQAHIAEGEYVDGFVVRGMCTGQFS